MQSDVTSTTGQTPYIGWWYEVYKDGALFDFGRGYKSVRKCLSAERRAKRAAKRGEPSPLAQYAMLQQQALAGEAA